uniref:Uncharacterized protein n=1 Tax=Chromera velia CCMP2878 TaxID=1169474 RepID=A0A0G4F0Y9_9ALVE|eukprot:Cvel_2625.t1-p1 / transcript=Cvel_2625.t1 / gene=Cvel_2625 / organism=Chromera_velia_CCMP2878 / gene_product=hypothetical protein / transcript_product=hypothetical protein / location=Cvel_scaffold104:27529-28647(-) / protein_length=373 / sequence_SO=supercontig / SO=protein_coding / is_pseudo=false
MLLIKEAVFGFFKSSEEGDSTPAPFNLEDCTLDNFQSCMGIPHSLANSPQIQRFVTKIKAQCSAKKPAKAGLEPGAVSFGSFEAECGLGLSKDEAANVNTHLATMFEKELQICSTKRVGGGDDQEREGPETVGRKEAATCAFGSLINKLTKLLFQQKAKSGGGGSAAGGRGKRKPTSAEVREAGAAVQKLTEQAESAMIYDVPSTDEIKKNGVAIIDAEGMDKKLARVTVDLGAEAVLAAAEEEAETKTNDTTPTSFLSIAHHQVSPIRFLESQNLSLLQLGQSEKGALINYPFAVALSAIVGGYKLIQAALHFAGGFVMFLASIYKWLILGQPAEEAFLFPFTLLQLTFVEMKTGLFLTTLNWYAMLCADSY